MEALRIKNIYYVVAVMFWILTAVLIIGYAILYVPKVNWNIQTTVVALCLFGALVGLWCAVELVTVHREREDLVKFSRAFVMQRTVNGVLKPLADELDAAYGAQTDFQENPKVKKKLGQKHKPKGDVSRNVASTMAFDELNRARESHVRSVESKKNLFWRPFNLLEWMNKRDYLTLVLGVSFRDYLTGVILPGEEEQEAA